MWVCRLATWVCSLTAQEVASATVWLAHEVRAGCLREDRAAALRAPAVAQRSTLIALSGDICDASRSVESRVAALLSEYALGDALIRRPCRALRCDYWG